MTIATALPRNQAIIDMYAEGASYKTVGRAFHHGEGRIRNMIHKHAPEIKRTKPEQLQFSAKNKKSFCLADLDQVELGPCAVCGTEHVGKG